MRPTLSDGFVEEVVGKVDEYHLRQSLAVFALRISVLELVVSTLFLLVLFIALQMLSNNVTMQLLVIFIIGGFLQLVNIGYLIYMVLHWLRTTYSLSPHEIILRTGVLHTLEQEYSLERVGNVDVDQSIIGKMFNYGTVHVVNPMLSSGVDLVDIPRPYYYAGIISNHIVEHQEEGKPILIQQHSNQNIPNIPK